MGDDNQTPQPSEDLSAARKAAGELIQSVGSFLKDHPTVPASISGNMHEKLGVLKHVIQDADVAAIRSATDRLHGAFEVAQGADAPVSTGGGALPPAPPSGGNGASKGEGPPPPPPEKGVGIWHHGKDFLARCLVRFRDHDDTPEWRKKYAALGVRSSRIYASLVLIIPPTIGWLNIPDRWKMGFTLVWCTWSTLTYLWFQTKAVIVQDVIRPEQTNKDILNSFLPVAAVLTDVVAYLVLKGVGLPISYGLGWFVLLTATAAAVFDLKLNNKIAIKLASIPLLREREDKGSSI